MPTVFISYRHEDPDHGIAVLGFAEALRTAGATVVLDQFAQAEEFCGGGPTEGWPFWSQRRAESAEYVLVINSPGWFAAWTGTAEPSEALGCAAEAQVLNSRLYAAAQRNTFLRIVNLESRPVADAPAGLAGYQRFIWPRNADGLKAWLRVATTAPGWPTEPPKLTWGAVANHQLARDAVAKLLTTGGGHLLRIRAASSFGKSTFLDAIEQNARAQPWLRWGRIDLSEPAREQDAVDRLCDHLGIPRQEGEAANRLSGMVDALSRQGCPTLVLFDTYEKASLSLKAWFVMSLPQLLQDDVAVRVVVAGQEVPSPECFRDDQRDAPVVPLQVPNLDDWFKLAQAQNPHVQAQDQVAVRERFDAYVAPLVERTSNPVIRQGLLPVIATYALKGEP